MTSNIVHVDELLASYVGTSLLWHWLHLKLFEALETFVVCKQGRLRHERE